jgi:hypothetical protein
VEPSCNNSLSQFRASSSCDSIDTDAEHLDLIVITRGKKMKKLTLVTALLAGYVLNDMVGAFVPMAQADDAGPEFASAVKDVVSGSCIAQRDALGVKMDLPIKCG